MSTAAATPLSRERILDSAVRLADAKGLEAASLRAIATDLGVHVTSLYHHLPTKEALLDGIVEQLFSRADLPVGELPWETWVRRFVAAVAELARAHPGAFPVVLGRPVQGPGANATFETGLAAFRRAGLDVAQSYGAVKSVALGVLGVCLDQASAAAGSDELQTDLSRLSGQDFPELHLTASVVFEVDLVAMVTEVLVAGLAHRLPESGVSPSR